MKAVTEPSSPSTILALLPDGDNFLFRSILLALAACYVAPIVFLVRYVFKCNHVETLQVLIYKISKTITISLINEKNQSAQLTVTTNN